MRNRAFRVIPWANLRYLEAKERKQDDRNLKLLGSILLATFSLSAMAASGAQAVEGSGTFSWAAGTTKLVGEADPTDPSQFLHFQFAGTTSSYTCNEISGEVTVTGTGAASVTAKNIVYSDVATTPETNRCTGIIEPGPIPNKATVNFNECDYHFIAGTTVASAPNGETEGTLEVKCPVGKKIKVTEAGCTVEVGEQKVGPVTYRTTHTTGKPEEVTAEAKIGEEPLSAHNDAIDYHISGLTCGEHNETNGTYTGKITIKGFQEVCGSSTQKDVTVT